MDSKEILLIVIGAVFGILFLTWIVITIIYSYFKDKVIETSKTYNKLLRLNQQYHSIFHNDIRIENNHRRICNSKREFDSVSLDLEFQLFIETKLEFFDNLLRKIEENQINYQKYLDSYAKNYIASSKSEVKEYKIPFNIYNSIEKKLYDRAKLEPILSASGSMYVSYTSPAGRNFYNKERNYSFEQIKFLIPRIHQRVEYKKTQEYLRKIERSKVTASLRYDVIIRDNSTCKLCNASVADGIKLQVDHIIPVSKGGKTKISNLQTLCERCNLGKSDKL